MEIKLHIEAINRTNELLTRLEKYMSLLTDAVTANTKATADNTTAVNAIPSASEVATAVTALNANTAQIVANNTTLAGDVAAPPVA